MTAEEFWLIIDSVNSESGGDMTRKCALLKERLTDLERSELNEFIAHFDAADTAAYSWPLWGAVFVMRGGCSDDSFSDFRATLISHGRQIYQSAHDDPDSLADVDLGDRGEFCCEGFQYVMHEVAEEQLGEIPQRIGTFPHEPSGEEWDEETVDTLYPQLAAKYSALGRGGSKPRKPWWKFW